MEGIPKVASVSPEEGGRLRVFFENGIEKVYDCRSLADRIPRFSRLRDRPFFRSVRVDPGGYGISWNDEVDLSEFELWINGF